MNNFYNTIVGNLSGLTIEELNYLIEVARNEKERIKAEKKRLAATDLVETFIAYKKATGRNTIKLYDCSGWDNNGTTKTDIIINIDHLFVNDNGNICHNILF